MRLFIAATLAPKQLQELERAQNILRRGSEKISLTKAENLHLTLHFLGETEAVDTERLLSALREFEVPRAESLNSRLAAYGYFERRDGYLIYADLAVSPQMIGLREKLGLLVHDLGFELDRRRWKAHVTLARRTRLNTSWEDLQKELPLQEERYTFSGIVLFKSEFTAAGMLYTPLFTF